MDDADRYFQFPLWLLTQDAGPGQLGESLIRYGGMLAGQAALKSLTPEKRVAACARHGLSADAHSSWELAASLGEEVLGIRFGRRQAAIEHFCAVNRELELLEVGYGGTPLVRVRKGLLFDFAKGNTLSVREFRVLMAIYSSIGSRAYSTIPLRLIRVRAMGWKTEAMHARETEGGDIPGLFTPKQIRSTVTRLHELGWYARVTPDPHGRVTYYSHRLSHDELREKIYLRRTRSRTFADEHRRKNAELAERIRKAGSGDAPPQNGEEAGNSCATNGRSTFSSTESPFRSTSRSTGVQIAPPGSASDGVPSPVPATLSRARTRSCAPEEISANPSIPARCLDPNPKPNSMADSVSATLSRARLQATNSGVAPGLAGTSGVRGPSGGSVGTPQGQVKGTFNRNASDKNAPDKNSGRGHSDRFDRRPPTLSELEEMGYARNHSEILEYVNRKLVPIGYLPVNTFSKSVVHICNVLFPVLDYQSTIDSIAEDGPPRKGEATFYRAAWERYDWALAPQRDNAYWAAKRRAMPPSPA